MTHRIFAMPFAKVYPLYLAKAQRKGRTKEDVDQIIHWMTGYDAAGMARVLEGGVNFTSFFADAPAMNPNRARITGVICGIRVEEIEDPMMREIRILDKMIDELAKGKPMAKILRT